MKSKKGREKHAQRGKRFLPDLLTTTVDILRYIRYTDLLSKEIAKKLGMSKQKLGYHIHKLEASGVIYDLRPDIARPKKYRLTTYGKNLFDQFEKAQKTEMAGVENDRWIGVINNTTMLRQFLKKGEYDFKENTKMNNIELWNGRIVGNAVKIIIGKVVQLEIAIPVNYNVNLLEVDKQNEMDVMNIILMLNQKWKMEIGSMRHLSTAQITMSTPFAREMMKLSGGAQVKVDDGVSYDQSHHGEPREEYNVKEIAKGHAILPLIVQKHVRTQEEYNNEVLRRLLEIKEGILAMAEGMAKTNDMSNKIQMEMANRMKELIGLITGNPEVKTGQNEVKGGNPISSDASRMFG